MQLTATAEQVVDMACNREWQLLSRPTMKPEALDSEGFEFGVERLSQSVRASATESASAIVRRVIEDVRNFAGSHPQQDDITLIAIRKI